MTHYVYRVLNITNGRCYIGETDDPVMRREQHFNMSKKGSLKIMSELSEFGREAFTFEVLAVCPDVVYARELEVRAITAFNSAWPHGYNVIKHRLVKRPWREVLDRVSCPFITQMAKREARLLVAKQASEERRRVRNLPENIEARRTKRSAITKMQMQDPILKAKAQTHNQKMLTDQEYRASVLSKPFSPWDIPGYREKFSKSYKKRRPRKPTGSPSQ